MSSKWQMEEQMEGQSEEQPEEQPVDQPVEQSKRQPEPDEPKARGAARVRGGVELHERLDQ